MTRWSWELRVGIVCPMLLPEMAEEVTGDELSTAWEEGFKRLDLSGSLDLCHMCIRSETYHFLVEWHPFYPRGAGSLGLPMPSS